MELLFRGIARAGGIEVPNEVRIFAPPEPKERKNGLSIKTAQALSGLARAVDRLAARLASHAGPAGDKAVAQ